MALLTVLIPVGVEPELLSWLEQFGLAPRSRAQRYPTVHELRAAAQASGALKVDEQRAVGKWRANVLFGAITAGPGDARHYAGGGFELNADIDPLDDDLPATSVEFRGDHPGLDAVAAAIANTVGSVVTVDATDGTPRLHEPDCLDRDEHACGPRAIVHGSSDDPEAPFANLQPIVDVLLNAGNAALDGGFVRSPDGWRCRLARPIDFNLIREILRLPATVTLSEGHDTVLDQSSWCSVEGPGAHPDDR